MKKRKTLQDFDDELVQQFQKTIREIKTDREMGERYMTFEELLREEKQEGRQEGKIEATQEAILALLEELGQIPEELQAKIEKIDSLEALKSLLKLVAKVDSLRSFEEAAASYFHSEENE